MSQKPPLLTTDKPLPDSLAALQLQVLHDRGEFFWEIQNVSLDDIRGMRASLEQFFSPTQAVDLKKFNDYELGRIMVIQRIYEFLYLCHSQDVVLGSFEPEKRSAFRPRYELWIEELCLLEEFLIVHVRQGRYYSAFSRWLNPIMYRRAKTLLARCNREHGKMIKGEEPEERERRLAEEERERQLYQEVRDTAVSQAAEEIFLRRSEGALEAADDRLLAALFGTALTKLPEELDAFVAAATSKKDEGPWMEYFGVRNPNNA